MDEKTINSLIEKLDKKQLQELITYIVSVNESAKELLLHYCQKKESGVKTDNYAMIIESKIQQNWKIAARIIEEFDMYGGGSESDEKDACAALEEMIKLLEDNEISWIVRKEILDEMLEFVASDNSGFTDYLELAAYYRKNNDKAMALKIVLEGLDKAKGRLDEIYKYLFQYYEENKNEAALEKLYAKSEKRNRNQDTITELMYQYYQKKGNYGKQKEMLLKLLSCCDNRELCKFYQKCRQDLSNEDFRKEEPAILNIIKNRNLSAYFDILMDKGETKEIIEYLTQHQSYRFWNLDQGHYFSKRLSDEYPQEVVDMYWKEVAFYVGLGREKNYAYAVEVLKEIQTIMKRNKWTNEWNNRYKIFLEEHKRKKLLLKVLESFKA